MKKILFVAFLTLIGYSAIGQNYRFGIFADPQFFWLKTDSKKVDSDGIRTNFNVGLAMEKYFAKRYAFLTGISMNGVGGELNYKIPTTIHTKDGDHAIDAGTGVLYKLQYLSVPLGLKFCTNEIGYLTYYAHLGVTNHILIRAKADIDKINVSKENVRDEVYPYTASYQIGLGAEYSLGGDAALQLGVTYSNGIIDVLKSSEFNAINSGVSIRVGVMF